MLRLPLSAAQARRTVEGVAKTVYARAFERAVAVANRRRPATATAITAEALPAAKQRGGEEETASLLLLDMFGFESFDMVAANRLHGGYSANSLEQLLINYTNEALQQRFTADTVRAVHAEYGRRALPGRSRLALTARTFLR